MIAGHGPLYNTSAVFQPDGRAYAALVRKFVPTTAEQPFVASSPAEELPTFDTPAGRLGVLICADSWYPEPYQRLKAEAVELIAVPSFIDTLVVIHTIIQSFEADSLDTLHQLNPKARLCALSGLWQFAVKAPAGDAQYVCPMAEMAVLDPYMIRQAHDDGRRVILWFGALQNPFLIRLVEFFGGDGIIVDDPALVQQTLR